MQSPFIIDLPASPTESSQLVHRTHSTVSSGMPTPTAVDLGRVSSSKAESVKSDVSLTRMSLTRNVQGSGTDWGSVFNMVNGVLGAGVLGYPYCYKLCGFFLTTFLLLVCFGVCQITMRFLIECSQITGKRTYESIGRACVGVWGERAVKVCISVLNIGALVAYINILSDILSSVAGTMIPPALEPSRKLVMVGVALLGLLPIGLLVTEPARLQSVSSLSVGMIVLFAVAMCVFALQPIKNANPVKFFRLEGIAIAFPVVGYGFAAHTVLFPVYNTMKHPTVQGMQKVMKWAGIVNASVYFVVGVMGYTAFRQRVHGDVLRNLGYSPETGILYEAYQYLLKVGYGASILGCVPIVLMPLHTTFFFLIDPSRSGSSEDGSRQQDQGILKNSITTAVVFLALALAIMVPNVEFIFGLVGATATVMVAYVLPSLFYLEALNPKQPAKQTHHNRYSSALCIAIIIFGSSIAILGTRATLTAVQEEAEVVELASKLVQHSQIVQQAEEASKKVSNVANAVKVVDSAAKDLSAAQIDAEQAVGEAQKVAQALQNLDKDQPIEFWDIRGQIDKMTGQSDEKAIKEVSENLKAVSEKVNSTVKNLETLTKNLEQQKLNESAQTKEGQAQPSSFQLHVSKERLAQAKEEVKQEEQKQSVVGGEYQGEEEDESKESRAIEIAQQLAQTQKQDEKEEEVGEKMTKEQLQQVQLRANMTLVELKRTASILTALEKAAQQIVQLRQGQLQDPKAKQEAVELLQSAISQTLESSRSINTTMGLLKGIAQTQTSELLKLLLNMAHDVSQQADQKIQSQNQQQATTIQNSNITQPGQVNNMFSISTSQEEVADIEVTSHELVQQLVEVVRLVEGGINLQQVDNEQNMTWLVAAADAAKVAATTTATSAKQDMKAKVQKELEKSVQNENSIEVEESYQIGNKSTDHKNKNKFKKSTNTHESQTKQNKLIQDDVEDVKNNEYNGATSVLDTSGEKQQFQKHHHDKNLSEDNEKQKKHHHNQNQSDDDDSILKLNALNSNQSLLAELGRRLLPSQQQ